MNQCQFEYNQFGQLVTEFQSHDGEVDVETTPSVGYTYADGSDNTIRATGLVYPNGRELTYAYGAADGIDDRASRIASIIDDDTTHLADYAYLGRQTFVEQDDTEPQLKWTLVDLAGANDPDTGDIYSGLDRFGRVKDNRWYNYDAEADIDRIQYGYDRAGNRVWRKNLVAELLGKKFDELYGYDAIHRLKDLDRGTLTTLKEAINDPQFAECWSLDATGNWAGYKQSDDGSGWSLEQSRTANEVNEITNISETTGPSWVTPAYSPAGNMTTMPQPNDPANSYTATYDAWNRLVKIADGADSVSAYAYDGAKRRILQLSYEEGVLSETRHLYYTEPSQWQVIEERLGTSPDSANAERQFVWGLRYIDDLIVRDRDTDANGTLDERLYACQDANWNVTAIVDNSGDVQERYAYSAYGMPVFLSSVFVQQASAFDWGCLYCGYRYDLLNHLHSVRHRIFYALIGNWLQHDPVGVISTINLYRYVSNKPISRSDPTGLFDHCGLLQSDGLACACGVIDILSGFGSLLNPAFLAVNPTLALIVGSLSFIDCLCDAATTLAIGCDGPRCHEWASLQSFFGTLIGCAATAGSASGQLSQILSIVASITSLLLEWDAITDAGFPEPPAACLRALNAGQ